MKRVLKKIVLVSCFSLLFINCKSSQEVLNISDEEKAIFNNDETEISTEEVESEYDIIVIDNGFNTWLKSIAKPEGFYSQSYMESRNIIYVNEWNRRVLSPQQYNPSLYEQQINYEYNVDYGYDVNYQLYNYFIYFQRKYNQRLGSFVPRI